MVLTDSEMKQLAYSPLGEDLFTTLIFSAKEAFYKAQYPLFKKWLNFKNVEITVSPETGCFAVTTDKLELSDLPICGRYEREGTSLTALVVIGRSNNPEGTV